MKTWTKKGPETSVEEVFLRNIGVASLDDVNNWFKMSYGGSYTVDNLDEAAKLALSFKNKPVKIIGDYDVDGTTSTSILYLALKSMGFKNVSYRIPKRFSEGFGINQTIIDEVNEGLIITCDNGIAQIDAIKAAKDKGLTVIILDHHEPVIEDGKAVLPEADIIVDPNAIAGSAVFNGYCGAGLCYKFARALGVSGVLQKQLQSLAALGTIADVMELREENYVFVRNGLKYLMNPDTTTPGAYALVSTFNLSRFLTAHDVAFKLGPAINACSRMKDDGAKDAVELLTFTDSYLKAIPMAEAIVKVNDARKLKKEEAIIAANAFINDNCIMGDIPMVIRIDNTPEGVIGIVAGNVCEEYGVPAIVLAKTEEGILKGSARSCGNYHMKNNLDKVSSLLLRYGGHEGAAGLSLLEENYEEFCSKIQETGDGFIPDEEKSSDTVFYDLEIQASQIPEVITELSKYEPFGNGNPAPVFKVTNYSVNPKGGSFINKVTSSYDITKLYYKNDVVAIGFDMSSQFTEAPKSVSLVGTLSDNYFNGKTTHQCEFVDFKLDKLDRVQTPLAAKLQQMAMLT
ncbi:MAG: DHH family phosphoesterase [Butyrivibrio sp.]|nr:DHH family phosphoesterase [Butyrivibrio sp.]